jgi:hypothetical protein
MEDDCSHSVSLDRTTWKIQSVYFSVKVYVVYTLIISFKTEVVVVCQVCESSK